MKEKKTVLFLMNGFGVETNKSFEVYSKEVMPTFDKLISAYPFKLVHVAGELIGANEGETSNFKNGYHNFSTFGNQDSKFDILKKKIELGEFQNNQVINDSIDVAVKNNSRLHVMFTLGNIVNEERYEQFNIFVEKAISKGIKEIYMHLVLGDSSLADLRVGNNCISTFKNRVIRFHHEVKIASICGKKYMKTGANLQEITTFYRMMVSGVGEVWPDYAGTIKKKYNIGMSDDSINGFITIKEPLLRENDSLLMFNYNNEMGGQFLTILMNPKKFFPTAKVPENVHVNSLFKIDGIQNVPYAFDTPLPELYFLDKIPTDKKVLIMASKERISYISSTLNGYRKEFKSNVSVWPIEDKVKRFETTSQYLAAYINQDIYDLIIVDCQLYEPNDDARTIEQIKKNMQELDKCLNITYNQVKNKDYRLIVTSLYGIRYTFKLTSTMELVDLSKKAPFLIVDREIRKVDMVFKNQGTFIDVAKLIAYSFGNMMNNNLVNVEIPGEKQPVNKKKILLLIPILLLVIFVLFYLFYMGYLG